MRTGEGESYVVFGGASLPATINLSSLGNSGITLHGATSGDKSGQALSTAGDVNADGFDDILVGVKAGDGAGDSIFNSGDTYLIFGSASPSSTIDLADLGALGCTFFGVDSQDLSGRSVSSAGDLNGDGCGDILIGAVGSAGAGNSMATAGESYVVFGGTSFPAVVNLATLGTGGITIFGGNAADSSGFSVASAGDVNGDGFDDLLIGAPGGDGPGGGRSGAGSTYVIFGGPSLPGTITLNALGTQGLTIFGVAGGDNSGVAVSGGGDINGDGFADIIIGASAADGAIVSLSSAGESYVVFGADFKALVTHQGSSDSETLTGDAAANSMNGAVGSDILLGNGGPDIIYGGSGDDVLAVSDGTLWRIDGGNGTDTLRLDGNGISLDLNAMFDLKLRNLEIIDIRGSGANTLTLNLHEVLELTANSNPNHTANTLRVRRDANDTVNVGSGWTQGPNALLDGVAYQVFSQEAAALLIEHLDKTAPDVTVTSTTPASTNAIPIPVTITFTEAMIGFTESDISVGNATLSNFVAVSALVYTVDVTATSAGTVTVNIAAGVATDLAFNPNTAAAQFVRIVDTVAPTLTISPDGTSTNLSQVTFTFQFSETVTGFQAGDISLTNGSAGVFTAVDGDTYTLVANTPAEGTVSVWPRICSQTGI